jgi:UDP-2,4-diacetamido-2,4,6-trideoxy-beta-L-altropyranose hydrolase
MRVAFRADSSLEIGTGHVMRCLTLADNLATHGVECLFMCREHPGNLIQLIMAKGHLVFALPFNEKLRQQVNHNINFSNSKINYGHWLGSTQEQDAQLCTLILAEFQPDWLIVDHYSLDIAWELALKPYYGKLLVIDDLADRLHACNILLDQTFARNIEDYRLKVPVECRILCGSQYALLRPEFAALRPYSLGRRAKPALRELLITMGGVDKNNMTGRVMKSLSICPLPAGCRITVVMGSTSPSLDEVLKNAQEMPCDTRVLIGVSEMAQLMAESDLAIGAAGMTSWERCCLGLPTIMFVLAKNQLKVAHELERVTAAALISSSSNQESQLLGILREFSSTPQKLQDMSESCAAIVDGMGAPLVTSLLDI